MPRTKKNTVSQISGSDYMAPVNELLHTMEQSSIKLEKLLESTPVKLDKAIAGLKKKQEKLLGKKVKTKAALAQAKAAGKGRASAAVIARIEKFRLAMKTVKEEIETLKAELEPLAAQRRLCQAMHKERLLTEKLLGKVLKAAAKKTEQAGKKKKKAPALPADGIKRGRGRPRKNPPLEADG